MKHPNTVDGVMQFVVDNGPIIGFPATVTVITEHTIHTVQLVSDTHVVLDLDLAVSSPDSGVLVMTSENLVTLVKEKTEYDVTAAQFAAIANIMQAIAALNASLNNLRNIRLEALSDSA